MSRVLRKTYTSAFYVNRDPEFEKLCNVLRNSNLQEVADRSGVHVTTLYNWIECRTYGPRITTLVKVAKAVGFRFKLTRKRN